MPPVLFGAFVGDAVIARGATAEVWGAHHALSGAPVAVKVILEPGWSGHEVQVAAGLVHPNITQLYDLGRTEAGQPWVAMERASGGSLEDAGVLRWEALLEALCSTLEALAYLHASGLVHRDVKRANLLRFTVEDATASIKLADFGIAAATSDRPAAAGSPETMAPEQIRGERKALGPWTDLYALGVVAHQLATGTLPWQATSRAELLGAHQHSAPTLGPARVPVPDGFFEIISILLRKAPGSRYQRSADVLAALRALPRPRGESTPAPAPRRGADTFAFDVVSEPLPESPEPSERAPPAVTPIPWPLWRTTRPDMRSPFWDAGLGLIALRKVPLVGREVEREQLWQQLAAVTANRRPAVVVIDGPQGVGKSALSGWFGARADELGLGLVAHLTKKPFQSMSDVAGVALEGDPLRGLTRWLERFGPPPGGLAGEVLAAAAAGGEVVAPWFRLAAHVSRHRPVLILADCLEDVPEVSRFVEAALRARAYIPGAWMVVAAVRSPSPALAQTADLRMTLSPVSDPQAEQVLNQHVPLSPEVAPRLWRESQGDLGRALDELRTAGATGRLVRSALGHQWSPEAADPTAPPREAPDTWRRLAALGGEATVAEAEAETGADIWVTLAGTGWLRGDRVRIPLSIAVAIRGADPEGAARSAAAVARWQQAGDLRRTGLALAVAGRGSEAVAALVEYGDHAVAVDDRAAIHIAVALFEEVADLLKVPLPTLALVLRATRARLHGHLVVLPWTNLGNVHLRAGRLDEARTQFEQALWFGTHVAPSPFLMASIRVGLASVAHRRGDTVRALEHLQATARQVDPGGNDIKLWRGHLQALEADPELAEVVREVCEKWNRPA